jgi:hypothetical protein
MSLEDDLSDIVNANRDRENRMNIKWKSTSVMIRSRFAVAANRLNDRNEEEGNGNEEAWTVDGNNGSVDLLLRNSFRGSDEVRRLSFSREENTGLVIRRSTENAAGKSFDITMVTVDEVEDEIREFVKVVTA